MACCIVSQGCGLDPKIKVTSLFKNKNVFFKKDVGLFTAAKMLVFCSVVSETATLDSPWAQKS